VCTQALLLDIGGFSGLDYRDLAGIRVPNGTDLDICCLLDGDNDNLTSVQKRKRPCSVSQRDLDVVNSLYRNLCDATWRCEPPDESINFQIVRAKPRGKIKNNCILST